METLFCKTRDEWREWLAKNHLSEKEIWLIYFKKHTKKETIVYNDAVEEALCFGWIDSIVKRIDDETYMQKYTPRKPKSVWSLINTKRVEKLIQQNKMTQAGLDKVEIAKKNGQWGKAYSTKKDTKMPIELEKALSKNKSAFTNFYNFTKGYQNQYINWINAAKKEETKLRRIKTVIERCKKNLKAGIM